MLHDLNEAEHGSKDADGRRKAGSGFKNRGQPLFAVGCGVQADLHDAPQFRGLGAVHGKHHRLTQERIVDGFEIAVERDHAIPAGLVCERDEHGDQVVVLLSLVR